LNHAENYSLRDEEFGIFYKKKGMDVLFPIVSLFEKENVKIIPSRMSKIFVNE